MNIGIIGGGSIGLLISSYMSENHNVTLYVRRKEQQKIITEKQILLLESSKVKKTVSVSVKLITEMKLEDCFIICVKQTHISDVISHLKKFSHTTPLIFLQNGMGHIESVKQLNQPSYVGVVEHGAHRLNENSVNQLGHGVIKLASITGKESQLHYLINALHRDMFPFEKADSVTDLLKKKLIINAVINPLTALFNVANGEIVTNRHIHFLAKNICAEAAFILSLDFETSWQSVLETARNTSENVSSMRADIQHGRQTEIEAITGYILSENHTNEKLAYTTFVYHAILSLTPREGLCDENSIDR